MNIRITKRVFFVALAVALLLFLSSYKPYGDKQISFLPNNSDTLWADSILKTLSLEEKIGQLLNIRVYSKYNPTAIEAVDKLINEFHVGGITFFQGGPVMQAELTNHWQSISKIPLMVAMDAESGLGWRYDSAIRMPEFMTMGALVDNSLIFQVGKTTGRHCKRVGVDMDFSPVVDVNNNVNNPVINFRSFGSNPQKVGEKARLFMLGLQSEKVLAVAKHFPGHGDTDRDSHTSLPLISHSFQRIDSIELVPFKTLIKSNVDGIMTAHLEVTSLEKKRKTASSLSKNVVTNLLQNQLGFKGLVITDGLDMAGVGSKPGKIEVKAFLAGNDILLLPQNVEKAVKSLKQAVKRGKISQERLNYSVRKILIYKGKVGCSNYKPLDCSTVYQDVNDVESRLLKREIYRKATTLISDKNGIIPFKNIDTIRAVVIKVGKGKSGNFSNILKENCRADFIDASDISTQNEISKISSSCKDKNLVIIQLCAASRYSWKNYGITENDISLIKFLAKQHPTTLCIAGNPYILENFKSSDFEAVIVGYEYQEYVSDVMAQILTGSLPAEGVLPIDVGRYKVGDGIFTPISKKLKFCSSEEVGVSTDFEIVVDSILKDGLKRRAYPGCQVIMARNGEIFYDKSFGYHTSKKIKIVEPDDLYDVASLTKILSTTLSIMRLSEQRKLDIDRRLGDYLPELEGTNKSDIVIRDLLAHQAKLVSWIPFYMEVDRSDSIRDEIYSTSSSKKYSIQIADNFYLRSDYRDTIFELINVSKLHEKKEYRYSDLGFYYLKEIIERISGESLNSYAENQFYKPLELVSTTYLPLEKFNKSEIVPTEKDNYWRNQLVHGYVHDMGAAMLGGVGGHAGLFSNASDVAVIMQMLLQGGTYDGKKYFDITTVREFTSCQFPLSENRRGIGFDKPMIDPKEDGPHCLGVSLSSFGHTGFTGCYAWADPESGIVYVFLSNRIYPTMDNKVLLRRDIRTKIHQAAYDAILK